MAESVRDDNGVAYLWTKDSPQGHWRVWCRFLFYILIFAVFVGIPLAGVFGLFMHYVSNSVDISLVQSKQALNCILAGYCLIFFVVMAGEFFFTPMSLRFFRNLWFAKKPRCVESPDDKCFLVSAIMALPQGSKVAWEEFSGVMCVLRLTPSELIVEGDGLSFACPYFMLDVDWIGAFNSFIRKDMRLEFVYDGEAMFMNVLECKARTVFGHYKNSKRLFNEIKMRIEHYSGADHDSPYGCDADECGDGADSAYPDDVDKGANHER